MSYHSRLFASARDLAGAYTQDELMTKFMQEIHSDIRLLLRRDLHSDKSSNHLRTFAEEKAAIYSDHKALVKPEKKVRVLSVEEDHPRRQYYTSILKVQ